MTTTRCGAWTRLNPSSRLCRKCRKMTESRSGLALCKSLYYYVGIYVCVYENMDEWNSFSCMVVGALLCVALIYFHHICVACCMLCIAVAIDANVFRLQCCLYMYLYRRDPSRVHVAQYLYANTQCGYENHWKAPAELLANSRGWRWCFSYHVSSTNTVVAFIKPTCKYGKI